MEFITPAGQRVVAITTDQMREVDRVAIEELGPNLFQMMENAGRNLAEETVDRLGERTGPIVACAGAGGNGGGAICAARHLANHGLDARVCLAAPEGKLGDVARAQLDLFRLTSGAEIAPGDLESVDAVAILDGLIGYSLRGAPRAPVADLITRVNRSPAITLALDVPSGIDAASGSVPGAYVRADVTVTLALPKTGLGHPAVGELVLADLGIPRQVFERAGIEYVTPFAEGYRVPLRSA